MIDWFNLLKHRSYRKVQEVNLLYPNEDYISSEQNLNKADLHRFSYIFKLHKHLKGSMLDIGCNDGYFMRHFPWKFHKYTGVDLFSITRYTKGRYWRERKYYTKNYQIRYKQGYFEDISASLGQFDFIFAGEIIEHVEDPELFLKSVKNNLKSGATWCISTPNAIGGDLPEHNRQFSKKSLNKLLSKYFTKFKIYEIISPGDSWPFLVATGKG